MRDSVKERLCKTEDGQALVDLVEYAGGWSAFLRATGYKDDDLVNWYKRGRISQPAAHTIAQMPHFQDAGWTREKILPSVKPFQWRV